MEINTNVIYYISFYNRIIYHKFFKAISTSDTGATFKMVEVKPRKSYSDMPYCTRGTMIPSSSTYDELYTGRYSTHNNPYIKLDGQKKFLLRYDGKPLEFDYND